MYIQLPVHNVYYSYTDLSSVIKMKFNTETERDKLRYAIWKKQYNISRSISSVFHRHYRDLDIIHINILSLLLQFSVISIRQIEELGGFHHRFKTIIFKLEEYGCVKIYFSGSEEYSSKKEMLPNLYEKGMIIESIAHIKELYNGAVFDMKKWKKISLAQLRRKTKTPYRTKNSTIIVEITDKGGLLLKKYIGLYSRFFNVPKDELTINKNVIGLFAKSVDELKAIVQKEDLLVLMIQNAHNRDEKLVSQ